MRQQAGLLEHPDRHRAHVVQRRVVAALVEPLPASCQRSSGRSPSVKSASLQPSSAPRRATSRISSGSMNMPLPCRAQLAGDRDERAVVAGVAAQVRDRDEDLARIADRQPAVGARADPPPSDPRRAPAPRWRTDRRGRRRAPSSRSRPRRRSARRRHGHVARRAAKRSGWARSDWGGTTGLGRSVPCWGFRATPL